MDFYKFDFIGRKTPKKGRKFDRTSNMRFIKTENDPVFFYDFFVIAPVFVDLLTFVVL